VAHALPGLTIDEIDTRGPGASAADLPHDF